MGVSTSSSSSARNYRLRTSELMRRNAFRLCSAAFDAGFAAAGAAWSTHRAQSRTAPVVAWWVRSPMSSLSLSSFSRISNRCRGKKKPPSAGLLYEGRALMLVCYARRGKRGINALSQLLRATPGVCIPSTVTSALVTGQIRTCEPGPHNVRWEIAV